MVGGVQKSNMAATKYIFLNFDWPSQFKHQNLENHARTVFNGLKWPDGPTESFKRCTQYVP